MKKILFLLFFCRSCFAASTGVAEHSEASFSRATGVPCVSRRLSSEEIESLKDYCYSEVSKFIRVVFGLKFPDETLGHRSYDCVFGLSRDKQFLFMSSFDDGPDTEAITLIVKESRAVEEDESCSMKILKMPLLTNKGVRRIKKHMSRAVAT